jgi:GDPmannose 4,6-dehydratase
MKKALITGVTGQDGSYLAELLIEKDYEVHGIQRRSSSKNVDRISNLLNNPNFHLHHGDLTDSGSVIKIISEVRPDEIYNLAAQSDVHFSFNSAENTADVNALGTLRILEAIKILGLTKTKFYQASTSEMFGKVQEIPQKENTPFYPRSPYGISKLYAHWITKNYRESYGLFACSGILFNHESPRRGSNFVTQKIVMGLHDISIGKINCLEIGNLNSKRDWGHAKDFVNAMWLILQNDVPLDFVIATGRQHSVREFIELCAPRFGMNIIWSGEGLEEIGTDTITGNVVVCVNPEYFRPSEVDYLIGDSTLAHEKLGWYTTMSFEDLIEDMCNSILGDEK